MPESSVLVIDDEVKLCELFTDILEREGLNVLVAHKGADGIATLDANLADIGMVFTDMKLPDMTGNEVLREVKKRQLNLPVVVVTGFATKDGAVEAMRLGAYDYLAKPFNIAEVSLIARRALERGRLIDENHYLRGELLSRYKFETIVGDSEKIQRAYILAAKVANQNATVLITGESGTG